MFIIRHMTIILNVLKDGLLTESMKKKFLLLPHDALTKHQLMMKLTIIFSILFFRQKSS